MENAANKIVRHKRIEEFLVGIFAMYGGRCSIITITTEVEKDRLRQVRRSLSSGLQVVRLSGYRLRVEVGTPWPLTTVPMKPPVPVSLA